MEKPFPERKVTRLPHFDYGRSGAYFVTMCCHERRLLFAGIVDGAVQLNVLGELVRKAWTEIPRHYPAVIVDEFIIMPNHLHGILFIVAEDTADMASHVPTRIFGKPQARSLSSIIGSFKSGVTREARRLDLDTPIWQPRFYDHIIRNDKDLYNIRKYIRENPLRWEEDNENPRM